MRFIKFLQILRCSAPYLATEWRIENRRSQLFVEMKQASKLQGAEHRTILLEIKQKKFLSNRTTRY